MKDKRWKRLFFLLAGINVLIVIILWIILSLDPKDDKYIASNLKTDEYVPFRIETNKADLNKVINHYLEEEGLKGPIEYQVVLNDNVELYGSIPVFSQDLQMKLSFEPIALKNGDIVLQQNSISVGQLQLPVSYAMSFVRDKYKLPKWVSIQPTKKRIYVSLANMDLKSDVKVKVDKFDLKNDEIKFSLMVPVK